MNDATDTVGAEEIYPCDLRHTLKRSETKKCTHTHKHTFALRTNLSEMHWHNQS